MSDSPVSENIAIIGMAGRFPMAANVDEFWANLASGRDCFSDFSVEELVAAGVPHEVAAAASYVRRSPILEKPAEFDAHLFGFSPKEAEFIDPQHRLLMECAWEVLEHAGHDPHRFDGAIGIWAGCGPSNYFLKNILSHAGHFESLSNFNTIVGNDKDYLVSRIAYKFNLRGPSVVVQSACSTSLVAVHNACQALLTYQCDMALAGGVSLQFPRAPGYVFNEGEIFSRDGICRTFDKDANGTVLGEGCGMVALRRLEDAIASGDRILAVIRGSAVNNDGAARAGYTAPGVAGQSELIAMAQAVAGVEAGDISYIETHGTGTLLGDPIEVSALTKAFRQTTTERGFCGLGAVKPNIGHLDVAAGIAGLIKTICALQHRQLPGTLHFTEPNPELGLATSPFFVVDRLMDWQPRNGRRIAGVSSFGLGGTNAHIILEEYTTPEPVTHSRPGWHLLPVSAATETALQTARNNLSKHLETASTNVSLDAIASTLTKGRQRLRHRQCIVAENIADAAARLAKPDETFAAAGKTAKSERSAVFLFSGQGSQYPGMGSGLFKSNPVFRDAVSRCAEILGPIAGHPSLLDILYGTDETARALVNQTLVSQPALFAIEYGLARLWESHGIKPVAVLGHSIGEYVAACEAGIFSLEDALLLVRERARLMQSMAPGTMIAVLRTEEEVRSLMPPSLDLAVINAPTVCVVSGPTDEADKFLALLESKGINGQRLHTSHAFHSRMMEDAANALAEVVAKTTRHAPKIPIGSNLTGTWMTEQEATDPTYWSRHLRNAVRFSDNLAAAAKRFETAVLLETGPGNTLCSITRQQPYPIGSMPTVPSLRHPRQRVEDEPYFLRALGAMWCQGTPVNLDGLCSPEATQRIELPRYPFERERFLIEYAGRGREATELAEKPKSRWKLTGGKTDTKTTASANADKATQVLTLPKLVTLWNEMLGTTTIQPDDDFFDLGGHSLLAARMFVRIRDEFGINAPLSTLFDASTAAKLFERLKQNTGQGWQAWVPIVSAGDRVPVILVHGAEGNVLLYREMTMQMQPGQPVYGLQCKGLDGRGGHHERIEDMARDYVAEVSRHYPTGPLILGGYCMGGGVALEMAQQFKKSGRPATLVVMIESYNYIGCGVTETRLLRLFHSFQNLGFHTYNLIRAFRRGKGKGDFLTQKFHVEASRIKTKLKHIWASMARKLDIQTSADFPHFRLSAVNDKAYFDYTPTPYDGAIAVIRPEQQFAGYDQQTCGWDKIARGPLDIHVLPVSPRGMLVAPFSTDLGAAVRKAIDNVMNHPKP